MTIWANKTHLKSQTSFHFRLQWTILILNLINMDMIKWHSFLKAKSVWKRNLRVQNRIRQVKELRFWRCLSINIMENVSLKDKNLEIFSLPIIKKLLVKKHINVLINWIIPPLRSSMMFHHSKIALVQGKLKSNFIKITLELSHLLPARINKDLFKNLEQLMKQREMNPVQ